MEAQTALGDIYVNVSKTQPSNSIEYHVLFDSEKALKWYKEAFKNGNVDTAFKIGGIYRSSDSQQFFFFFFCIILFISPILYRLEREYKTVIVGVFCF
jgi:hypothetical protein